MAVSTAVIAVPGEAGTRSGSRLAGGRGRLPKIAFWVDSPAAGDLRELDAHRPAIGPLLARVIRRRALERHAAGVVAHQADLLDVVVAEPLLLRQARELGALLLDRKRSLPHLLDQGRNHAGDRGVSEVPLAGELHRGEGGALRDRTQALELGAPLRDPALRPEGAVVAGRQLGLRGDVVPEDAAIVDDPRDHADTLAGGGIER